MCRFAEDCQPSSLFSCPVATLISYLPHITLHRSKREWITSSFPHFCIHHNDTPPLISKLLRVPLGFFVNCSSRWFCCSITGRWNKPWISSSENTYLSLKLKARVSWSFWSDIHSLGIVPPSVQSCNSAHKQGLPLQTSSDLQKLISCYPYYHFIW